jgi:hypothetical protein
MASRNPSGKPPVVAHWKKDTLIQEYWLPEHSTRRESAEFRKNKKFLRDTCELPCWVCGASQSEENPLEVHHVFEWALWNAMEPRRVTAILEVLEFYEEGYLAKSAKKAALQKRYADAVESGPLCTPDDVRNLVVLCQQHHRDKGVGIHMISFPVWIGMAALKKGGTLTRGELARTAAHLRRLDEATADVLEALKEARPSQPAPRTRRR